MSGSGRPACRRGAKHPVVQPLLFVILFGFRASVKGSGSKEWSGSLLIKPSNTPKYKFQLFDNKRIATRNARLSIIFLFLIFFNIYLLLRDRPLAGEGQRERETQNRKQAQAPSSQHRARRGA